MENCIPLKILAQNTEDLNILSACLQDSLIPVKELEYDKDQKKFVMLLHRYRWEDQEAESQGSRIHAALVFDAVTHVQIKGMDQTKSRTALTLSLLSLSYHAPYVYITCADNISLRLEVDQLKVKLRDGSLAWPAKTPVHQA